MKPHFLQPLLAEASSRYILRNERTGQILASQIETAFDSAARRKGLLGRTGLADGAALILAPCNAIHTFWMRFTIDVAFVNRRGVVVGAWRGVRPWRLALGFGALAAVELPEGTLARTGTTRSHRLVLDSKGDIVQRSAGA